MADSLQLHALNDLLPGNMPPISTGKEAEWAQKSVCRWWPR